jgi:DNA-binding transcriptional regulator of glucitol operon
VAAVWRFALSRRWWAGHLLVALCCVLFIGLGRWQWDRAQAPTGDWQNLGYALQWPLFAVTLVATWVRFLWLEQHRVPELDPAPDPPSLTPPATRHHGHRPIPEDDPDDELAAYNAYLARLARLAQEDNQTQQDKRT